MTNNKKLKTLTQNIFKLIAQKDNTLEKKLQTKQEDVKTKRN